MKLKDTLQNKKSLIMLCIGVFTIFIFLLGSTYAYFQNHDFGIDQTPVQVTVATSDHLVLATTKNISLKPNTSNFNKESGDLKDTSTLTATLTASNTTNYTAKETYNVFLIITKNEFDYTTEEKTPEIILTIKDPTGTVVDEVSGLKPINGSLDITRSIGTYKIASDYDISTSTRIDQTWSFEVKMVNLSSNQNANLGKSFEGKIYVTQESLSSYEAPVIKTIGSAIDGSTVTVKPNIVPVGKKIDKYYYAIREKGSSDEFKYIESNNSEYTFKSLRENSTYEVSIYVIDEEGVQSNTLNTDIVVNNFIAPSIDDVKTSSDFSSLTVEVEATEGDGRITKYYYSKDNGKTFVETTDSSYTFENLNDTSTYDIVVKVEDENGKTTTFSKKGMTSAYVNPKITTVSSSSNLNSISLSVSAQEGTSPIAHYLYNIDNGAFEEFASSHDYINLKEDREYNIRIKVVDTKGRESTEYPLKVRTDAYKLPQVKVSNTSSTVDSITINVEGTDGSGKIVKYMYSKDNGNSWVTSKEKTITFDKLSSNTVFHVQVKAVDINNRISQVANADVKTGYIEPSVSLTFVKATENSITVKATSVAGSTAISKYEYSLDDSTYKAGTSSSNPNEYTFTGLSNTGNYTLYVRITDSGSHTAKANVKYDSLKAYSLELVHSYTNITATLKATKGTGNVTKYCFKVNSGACQDATKKDGTTGSYTFDYKVDEASNISVSAYAIDEYNRISNTLTKSLTPPKYQNPSVSLEITDAKLTNLTVRAKAVPGSTAIKKYEFSKDNRTWVNNDLNEVYKFEELAKNHEATVYVRVTDEIGKQATAQIQYKNPTIVFEVVSATSTTFNVKTTTTKGTLGIFKYEYQANDGSWENIKSSELTNTYRFNNLPNATNVLKVRVTDDGEHYIESSITYIDPAVKDITFGAVTATSAEAVATFTQGTSSLGHYEFNVNDGTWNNTSTTASKNFTGFASNSTPKIGARIADSKGRVSVAKYTTYVNPTVSMVLNSATATTFNVTATGTAATKGISKYEYQANSGSFALNAGTGATNTYNYTDLAGATNSLVVRLTDGGGHTATATINYTDPVVKSISFGTVTITSAQAVAEFTQGTNALGHYEFNVNDGTFTSTGTTANHNFTGLTSNSTPKIGVRIVDNKGRVSVAKYATYVNPTVSLNINSATASSFNVTATGTSGTKGISKYEYQANSGVFVLNTGTGTTNTYNYTDLTNHTNTLVVRITDAGEHTATATITYTDPTTTISFGTVTATSAQAVASATAGKLNSTNQNIAKYQFKVNDGSWVDAGTVANYNFTGLASNSAPKIETQVTDAKGRVSATATLTYKNPTVSLVINSATANSFNVTASGTAETKGISKYEYQANSGSFTLNSGTAATNTYNYTNLTGATNSLVVRITDGGGHTATATINYTDPVVKSISFGTVTITSAQAVAEFTQGTNALGHYEFNVNDGTFTNTGTTANHNFTGLTSNSTPKIGVRIVDNKGRVSVAKYATYVNPTVGLTVKSATSSSFTTTATGTVGTKAISKYEYSTNGSNWSAGSGTSTSNEYTFSNLTGHTNTLYVRLTDGGGHTAQTSLTYTDPSTTISFGDVTLTSAQAVASATVGKMGTTNEAIAKYQFRVNSGAWVDAGATANHNFTGLTSNSEPKIEVQVTDAKGRVSSIAATTYVNPRATIEIVSATANTFYVKTTSTVGTKDIKEYDYRSNDVRTWTMGNTTDSTNKTNTFTYNGMTLANNTLYVQVIDKGNHTVTVSIDYMDPMVDLEFRSGYISATSMGVLATTTLGTGKVSNYAYSKDNSTWYSGGTGSSYTFTGLSDSSDYTMRVRVTDDKGRQATAYVTYYNPKLTEFYISGVTYKSVTFTAKNTKGTADLSGYRVSYDGGTSWRVYNDTTTPYSNTIVTGKPDTAVTLKAYVLDTNNRKSTVLSASTVTDPYTFPTVSFLRVAKNSTTSITVYAKANPGDGAIDYVRFFLGDESKASVLITSDNTTWYTFSGLSTNTTYTFKLQAVDKNGMVSTIVTGSYKTATYRRCTASCAGYNTACGSYGNCCTSTNNPNACYVDSSTKTVCYNSVYNVNYGAPPPAGAVSCEGAALVTGSGVYPPPGTGFYCNPSSAYSRPCNSYYNSSCRTWGSESCATGYSSCSASTGLDSKVTCTWVEN